MVHHELVSAASRRALITGSSFSAAMKREAANWSRRQMSGQIASGGPLDRPPVPGLPTSEMPTPPVPVSEVDLPEPGAKLPDLPKPSIETPGAPEPVAESAASVVTDPMPIPGSEAVDPATTAELAKKAKNVGKSVTWSAFGTEHDGTIHGVVPAGQTPAQAGFDAGGDKAKPRDHISYVIRKANDSLVWPPLKGLTVKK